MLSILPNDCIIEILKYLEAKYLLNFSSTCSSYYKLSQNEELWEDLSKTQTNFWKKGQNITFKEHYRQITSFYIYRFSKYEDRYKLLDIEKEIQTKRVMAVSYGCFIALDGSVWVNESLCT